MGTSRQEASPLHYEGEIFAIEVQAEGAAIVLVLLGELDLAGSPRFTAALEAAMAGDHERIVLELAQLTFMDGASAGLIARARHRLRPQGRELALLHPQRHVRRVIELCASLSGRDERLDRGPAPMASPPLAEAAAVAAEPSERVFASGLDVGGQVAFS
jgi:anti-anti-sigma factor